MENRDTIVRLFIGVIVVLVLVTISLNKPNNSVPPIAANCKEDSLINVINSLHAELDFQEEGFSKKEQRYENILFEYQFGIERLKETHPSAYKEFHRIIAFKEQYSIEDKKENQKRLQWD